MSDQYFTDLYSGAASKPTRVWLGGMEVQFVKWTANAIIYTRFGSQETLAHLPRSTVQRLLREGMLRIEGEYPDWATPDWVAPDSAAE